MTVLERFSTSGLPPRQRVEFWNELCSVYTPVAVQPDDLSTFESSCVRTSVGDIPLTEIATVAGTVEHTSEHVARTREPMYFLILQLAGTSVSRQGGREAHLGEGEFTLLSSERPYQIAFTGANRSLVFAFSERQLQRQISSPEAVVAVKMSSEANLAGMLSQFATGLWRECTEGGAQAVGPALSSALLHLVGCTYMRLPGGRPTGSVTRENRRFLILRYIESHLHDRRLSPTTIGAKFKQSPRSLHMLFADAPETLSRYILRRRLEESARVLINPTQGARTVSEIAFENGFSSSAHFCKVFREHFATTPTEYRERNVATNL